MKQAGEKSVMRFFKKVSKKIIFYRFITVKASKKVQLCTSVRTQTHPNPKPNKAYLGWPLDQLTHLLNNMQQTNI